MSANLTYVSAADEGMFSSTHLRSSSYKRSNDERWDIDTFYIYDDDNDYDDGGGGDDKDDNGGGVGCDDGGGGVGGGGDDVLINLYDLQLSSWNLRWR